MWMRAWKCCHVISQFTLSYTRILCSYFGLTNDTRHVLVTPHWHSRHEEDVCRNNRITFFFFYYSKRMSVPAGNETKLQNLYYNRARLLLICYHTQQEIQWKNRLLACRIILEKIALTLRCDLAAAAAAAALDWFRVTGIISVKKKNKFINKVLQV